MWARSTSHAEAMPGRQGRTENLDQNKLRTEVENEKKQSRSIPTMKRRGDIVLYRKT